MIVKLHNAVFQKEMPKKIFKKEYIYSILIKYIQIHLNHTIK